MNPTGSALITVEHEAELWCAGIARWTTRCRCSSSSSSLIDEKTCDRWKRCTRKRRIISVREKAIIANSIPNPEITINLLSLSVKFSIRFDNSTRRVQRGRFDNYPLCSKTRLDSIRFDPPSPPSLRNRADPPMVHPSTYLANRFDPAPGGISIENGGNRFHFGFWKLRVIKGGRCSLPLFSCRWWQWHAAEAKVVGVSRRVKKWRGSWKLGPGTDDPGSGSGGGTAGVSLLSRVSFQDFFLIDPLFRKLFNFFVTGIVFFFCGF